MVDQTSHFFDNFVSYVLIWLKFSYTAQKKIAQKKSHKKKFAQKKDRIKTGLSVHRIYAALAQEKNLNF